MAIGATLPATYNSPAQRRSRYEDSDFSAKVEPLDTIDRTNTDE